ncbi:MAG: sulfatase [Pirellulaceae bacterium]|nr:sulfatase [Pirellulaceae bacterium]
MRPAVLIAMLIFGQLPNVLTAAPPNIVLILADDLGWADVGCYGNTFNETPHIDRLAREGMRFTQFYAGPVCSPTRANLQSGQDQARFGITQHIPGHQRPFAKLIDPAVPLQLPLSVETFAEHLSSAGYATGYFGKWHLGGQGFGPSQQGWQTAVETKGHTISMELNGQPHSLPTAEYLTDCAVDFIRVHQDRPFVMQISHHAVHIPLTTKPELVAKYKSKAPMANYPSRPEYAGLLEELDQSVGRIVATVDEVGLANNTLIVCLSDNGGLEHEQSGRIVTSNRPLRGEKGTLYEGGIRIPAIARWPGLIPAGARCEEPTITMDLHPTLLELANLPPMNEQPRDGVSLVRLLRDPKTKLNRNALFWHLPHYHHSTPASAIRQGKWKLIEFYESDTVELYDLSQDLAEQHNLAASHVEQVETMKTSLKAWRKLVGARMPQPNPNYDPERANELGKPSKGKRQVKGE